MRKNKPVFTLISAVLCIAFICGICTPAVSAADTLPVRFDPRPSGAVSAVRNQSPFGTCWDFAGISTLESYLIKNGLADGSIDLSEEDVLWWANGNYTDPESSGGGWARMSKNDGGFAAMVTGYYMAVGARSEADIPYFTETDDPSFDAYYGSGANVRPEKYYTAPPAYEVTDVAVIDGSAESVKKAISSYGAVAATYYDDHSEDDGSVSYFNGPTGAYWYPSFEDCGYGNHSVSVVGWDDTYPRTNFKEIDGRLPVADGAWLIKNSYGTGFGSEGGFIWISYEDKCLFGEYEEDYDFMYSVAGARPADNGENVKKYFLDEFGFTSKWYPETGEDTVIAAVYDFGENEAVSEVSFTAFDAGVPFTVYYAPTDGVRPVADRSLWVTLCSGQRVDHAGYNTVSCSSTAAVPAGKGAILLSTDCAAPCFGVEANLTYGGYRPLMSASVSDESFYLRDGEFVTAERTVSGGNFTYREKFDVSLRAATVPARTEEPEKTETGGMSSFFAGIRDCFAAVWKLLTLVRDFAVTLISDAASRR